MNNPDKGDFNISPREELMRYIKWFFNLEDKDITFIKENIIFSEGNTNENT